MDEFDPLRRSSEGFSRSDRDESSSSEEGPPAEMTPTTEAAEGATAAVAAAAAAAGGLGRPSEESSTVSIEAWACRPSPPPVIGAVDCIAPGLTRGLLEIAASAVPLPSLASTLFSEDVNDSKVREGGQHEAQRSTERHGSRAVEHGGGGEGAQTRPSVRSTSIRRSYRPTKKRRKNTEKAGERKKRKNKKEARNAKRRQKKAEERTRKKQAEKKNKKETRT